MFKSDSIMACISKAQFFIIAVLGPVFIVGAAVIAYREQWVGAATCAAIGLVLVMVSNLDKLESFKGLGIEAKVRVLDQKINEADETLTALRSLASLSGNLMMDLSAKSGRIGVALSMPELYARAMEVRAYLEKIGVDKNGIREALRPWAEMTATTMGQHAFSPMADLLKTEAARLRAECDELDRTVVHANHEKSLEMRQRAGTLDSYASMGRREIVATAGPQKGARLLQLIDEAPLPATEELPAIRAQAAQMTEEMNYLAERVEIRDPALLNSIRNF